jgi:hypothetical protein
MIQKEKTDGHPNDPSSPIRDGATSPGVTVAHPSEELMHRRQKDNIAHKTLRRKYGSTGSGGGAT